MTIDMESVRLGVLYAAYATDMIAASKKPCPAQDSLYAMSSALAEVIDYGEFEAAFKEWVVRQKEPET